VRAPPGLADPVWLRTVRADPSFLPEKPLTKGGHIRQPDFLVADLLQDWNWKTVFALPTGPTDQTHINFKELRAARMWLRRHAKKGFQRRGTRLVLLCDSRVCVGALTRGRSKSPSFNQALRAFIPLSIAGHIYLTPLWTPTGANPGDPPSRGASLSRWLKDIRDASKRRLKVMATFETANGKESNWIDLSTCTA
jgi:hypothetical protein